VSFTTRVLLGLLAGALLGFALNALPSAVSEPIVAITSPIGAIFVALIRMTVVPLVASMLVASIGSMTASGVLGRIGVRAAAIAIVMLTLAAAFSLAVALPILARVHIDQQAAMALRGPAAGAASGAAAAAPSIGQWLVDLVPVNVVKAAADGAMLPVILFAVLFALALGGVAPLRRDATLDVIRGIADAMQRLVAGILALTPIGVFALAVPLASRLGLAAAGVVIVYVVLVVVLTVVVGVVLLYPIGIVGGRMPPAAFAAFCAPAQAVAFASRSSLASLPAMIESAEAARMPPIVTGFFLPLAASVFRLGGAVAQTVGALFLARLYGVALSPAQLGSILVTVVLTSFAVPGIPGGSIIAMVPVLAAANVPIEGVGILLAVDLVPDMFRTTENVTGSLALAAVLRNASY
jgi:Na+/H+-dicarboxylate symporter